MTSDDQRETGWFGSLSSPDSSGQGVHRLLLLAEEGLVRSLKSGDIEGIKVATDELFKRAGLVEGRGEPEDPCRYAASTFVRLSAWAAAVIEHRDAPADFVETAVQLWNEFKSDMAACERHADTPPTPRLPLGDAIETILQEAR